MEIWIIIILIVSFISLSFLFRNEVLYFLKLFKYTNDKKKSITDLQKQGMNIRAVSKEKLKEYIKISKKYLRELNVDINGKFILDSELEMHLKYSKFSEKYVKLLLENILDFMKLDKANVILKIEYMPSYTQKGYVGEFFINKEKSNVIAIYIKNGTSINEVISILAHESTHYLLLSNNIKLEEEFENEILTDVTAIILGFGKYMLKGYKIPNNVTYDYSKRTRFVNKNRIGYLTYKDIKYVIKTIKRIN